MDIPLDNDLQKLELTEWQGELLLKHSLVVTGQGGAFKLTDSATIRLDNNPMMPVGLSLLDLGNALQQTNQWTSGDIVGANAGLFVSGSTLYLKESPGVLGADLVIQKSAITQNNGFVVMVGMANNLTLGGVINYIDVGNGGFLQLWQHIGVSGLEDTIGGIDVPFVHQGEIAIYVEPGGTLERSELGDPVPGVPDRVKIGRAIYNVGGTVQVLRGSMLNITGVDNGDNFYSYWQKSAGASVPGSSALLKVDAGSSISAVGVFQIDVGTVKLTASSGDIAQLDGSALVFGNTNATFLTIMDSITGTPGNVIIAGDVALGALTTTTLNFKGANNTADRIWVIGGSLTLDGALYLLSIDDVKPTQTMEVFVDIDIISSIEGDFLLITDNLGDTYTGDVIPGNPAYYEVTMD